MADVTETAARVRTMLENASWKYSVDEDDPTTMTLEFETSVRESLSVHVLVGPDWVVVSHIVGRNPTENEAAMHRRLLELNWELDSCKFAVDGEGDIVLLDEQLASDLDEAELVASVNAICTASEDYYDELTRLGLRA